MRRLYRTDGTFQDIPNKLDFQALKDLGGFPYADIVQRVVDGKHIMLVDDEGLIKRLPINAEGTRFYREVCRPGFQDGFIHGDVVIVPDGDIE